MEICGFIFDGVLVARFLRNRGITKQGVTMLSSVLKSDREVNVNIAIMRAFVELRRFAGNYKELMSKIESMEKKYDSQFRVVFETIKQLMRPPSKSTRRMGF